MIWIGIVGMIFTVALLAFLIWADDLNADYLFFGGICFLAGIASIYLIVESINPTPTALDVYRGKTTLEITYRDSVAVDSVVVYKMK